MEKYTYAIQAEGKNDEFVMPHVLAAPPRAYAIPASKDKEKVREYVERHAGKNLVGTFINLAPLLESRVLSTDVMNGGSVLDLD